MKRIEENTKGKRYDFKKEEKEVINRMANSQGTLIVNARKTFLAFTGGQVDMLVNITYLIYKILDMTTITYKDLMKAIELGKETYEEKTK